LLLYSLPGWSLFFGVKRIMRSIALFRKALGFALFLAVVGHTTPVAQGAQMFTTPAGSSVGDGPVDASATFTYISGTTFSIVVKDLLPNPTSVGQTVNGVTFTLSNGTIASLSAGLVSQTGMQRTVTGTGAGQYSDAGTSTSPVTGALMWNYSTGGSTVEVTSLGNHAAVPTVIGGPNGSNAYSNGGGSITGNHNPFLEDTTTLVLSIPGVTGSTSVTAMSFLFGTSPGEGTVTEQVPPGGALGTGITGAPEPATVTLLGIGILGMAGYGWRRRKVAPLS
jgi:hypothetical protein